MNDKCISCGGKGEYWLFQPEHSVGWYCVVCDCVEGMRVMKEMEDSHNNYTTPSRSRKIHTTLAHLSFQGTSSKGR